MMISWFHKNKLSKKWKKLKWDLRYEGIGAWDCDGLACNVYKVEEHNCKISAYPAGSTSIIWRRVAYILYDNNKQSGNRSPSWYVLLEFNTCMNQTVQRAAWGITTGKHTDRHQYICKTKTDHTNDHRGERECSLFQPFTHTHARAQRLHTYAQIH